MFDLKLYGYTETETPADGLIPGRIAELRREQYSVITELGEVKAVLKGAFCREARARGDYPCVGDFALLRHNGSGVSRIEKLLPRRAQFSRADFLGHAAGYAKTIREQVVAANFDYVFVVLSLNKVFKVSRIMRYLTLAWQSGGQPVVILTKADLVDDFSAPLSQVRQAAPGVLAHAVSSRAGFGLDALGEYLQPGKTAVFLGMSGVGKSSLVNALMMRDVMAVRAIREQDGRGRHATTHRQLFMLPSGAMIIDTPGMRELGLICADEGISAGFADVEELFAQCRFSDCRHETEPGCAVRAAFVSGALSSDRWKFYLAQTRENKFASDKAGYIAEKGALWKRGAVAYRKERKNGGIWV